MKNKKVIPKKLILAIFKLKQIQPGVFEHVLLCFVFLSRQGLSSTMIFLILPSLFLSTFNFTLCLLLVEKINTIQIKKKILLHLNLK